MATRKFQKGDAYKAWLDEERDGRLRSAFEAGWEARGEK